MQRRGEVALGMLGDVEHILPVPLAAPGLQQASYGSDHLRR
jgi:hypothetical protein